jgi:hypothetical protein
MEALELYGKNWNKVHRYVGTRTSAQTRSHAQKYFNKLQKKGSSKEEGPVPKKEETHHSGGNEG